jgi:hypothetical protein
MQHFVFMRILGPSAYRLLLWLVVIFGLYACAGDGQATTRPRELMQWLISLVSRGRPTPGNTN